MYGFSSHTQAWEKTLHVHPPACLDLDSRLFVVSLVYMECICNYMWLLKMNLIFESKHVICPTAHSAITYVMHYIIDGISYDIDYQHNSNYCPMHCYFHGHCILQCLAEKLLLICAGTINGCAEYIEYQVI